MRFGELEKRAYEKQRLKDRIDHEAKVLVATTDNKLIVAKLNFLTEKWLNLRDGIRNERLRLDAVCRVWREFQTVFQDLDQWVKACRIKLQEDHRDLKSVQLIREELEEVQVSIEFLGFFIC